MAGAASAQSIGDLLRNKGIDPKILERLEQQAAAQPLFVQGRFLVLRKLNSGQQSQTFWNFATVLQPLGIVTTDLGEFGFSVDVGSQMPATAFKLANDATGCAPVYVGFKPTGNANQIIGLFFCTDGSGGSGTWSGCNNFGNSGSDFYCPGLPNCEGAGCV